MCAGFKTGGLYIGGDRRRASGVQVGNVVVIQLKHAKRLQKMPVIKLVSDELNTVMNNWMDD